MENMLNTLITEKDLREFKEFISFVAESDTDIVLRNGIIQLFDAYCNKYEKSKAFRDDSSISNFFKKAQELFPVDDHLLLLHRYAIAKYRFLSHSQRR